MAVRALAAEGISVEGQLNEQFSTIQVQGESDLNEINEKQTNRQEQHDKRRIKCRSWHENYSMCEQSERRWPQHEELRSHISSSQQKRATPNLRVCTSMDGGVRGTKSKKDISYFDQRDCDNSHPYHHSIDLATTTATTTPGTSSVISISAREGCDNDNNTNTVVENVDEIEAVWNADNYCQGGRFLHLETLEGCPPASKDEQQQQPTRMAQFIGSPIGRLKRSQANNNKTRDSGDAQRSGSLADEEDSGDDENCMVAAFSPVASPLTVDENEFHSGSHSFSSSKKNETKVSETPVQDSSTTTTTPKTTSSSLGAMSTFISIITCTAGACDKMGNPLESPPAKPMTSQGDVKGNQSTSNGTYKKRHPSSCLNKSSYAQKTASDTNQRKKKSNDKQVTWFINPCAGEVDELCYNASSWDCTKPKKATKDGASTALTSKLNIEKEISQILGRCYGTDDDAVACWQVLVPRQHGMCGGVSSCASDVVDRNCTETCVNKSSTGHLLENDLDSWNMYAAGKLRNRAGDLRGRQEKIKSMQYSFLSLDRTLTDNMGSDSEERQVYKIGHSAKSFDEGKFRKSRRRTPTNGRNSIQDISVRFDSDPTSQGFWSLNACDYHYYDAGMLPRQQQGADDTVEENDLCYDSDPTELRSARRIKTSSQERRKGANRQGSYQGQQGYNNIESPPTDECETDEDSLFSALSQQDILDLNNPQIIKNFIEETTNRKMRLIWHPTPEAGTTARGRTRSPIHTFAWIEMGCVMKRQLIYPKFSWNNKQSLTNQSSNMNNDIQSIELLHICRVYPVDVIDRTLFPFARKNRCFAVETFQRKALFEARSKKARDRIVQGLKITVARLGSMIIVGDETVFDAFFSPAGCEVPGEAPAWAKKL